MAGSQRQEKKKLTRSKLITAAMTGLAEEGLTKTATYDIAELARVSHGTVFAHFPTRDDLLIAVIEEFGDRVTRRIHELASGGRGVREVLIAHLQGLIEFEPLYTRLVIEGRLLPEKARKVLVAIQSAVSFHLSQAAEWEMEIGAIRRVPVHLLFNTWMGLIHYYLINGDLFSPDGSVLLQHGPALIEYYMALISP